MTSYPPAPKLEAPHEAADQRKWLQPNHIEWLRQVRSQGATLRWAAEQLGIALSTANRALGPTAKRKKVTP